MSNPVKFQINPVKGTDLWPDQMQAPPVFNVNAVYTGRSEVTAYRSYGEKWQVLGILARDDLKRRGVLLDETRITVNAERLQRTAADIVDKQFGQISGFIQGQRQNFSLSTTETTRSHRTFGLLDVTYAARYGAAERITATATINEQNIVDTFNREQNDRDYREEPVGASGKNIVIFHGGNKITYVSMRILEPNLSNPPTPVTRSLENSYWGDVEIIKTCQLPFNLNFGKINRDQPSLKIGAIYSEFGEFGESPDYYFQLKDTFAVTTTYLRSIATAKISDIKHDYPIMNVSEDTGTVYINEGKIEFDRFGFVVGAEENMDAPTSQSGERYKAFAISRTGERYYAGAYTTPSLGGSAIFIADNLTNKEIYDVTSVGPAPFLPSNPYQAGDEDIEAQRPSIVVSAGYYHNGWNLKGEDTTQSFPNPNGYLAIEYSYNQPIPVMICDEQKPGIVDVKLLPASGYYYDADPRSIITYRVANTIGSFTSSYDYTFALSSDTNDLAIVSYVHFLFPFGTTNWFGVSQYISHLSLSGYYNNRPVTCYFQTEYERIDATPYLHELGHPYLDPTPYFDVTLYRGWLHVANHDHVLQGFIFDDKKYLYLDKRPVTTLLDIPVEDIQTVFFDIPGKQLSRFK